MWKDSGHVHVQVGSKRRVVITAAGVEDQTDCEESEHLRRLRRRRTLQLVFPHVSVEARRSSLTVEAPQQLRGQQAGQINT